MRSLWRSSNEPRRQRWQRPKRLRVDLGASDTPCNKIGLESEKERSRSAHVELGIRRNADFAEPRSRDVALMGVIQAPFVGRVGPAINDPRMDIFYSCQQLPDLACKTVARAVSRCVYPPYCPLETRPPCH